MEDDFHHFRVEIAHEGGFVISVDAQSPRSPYSLCPAAGAQLRKLVGLPLSDRTSDVFDRVDARLQCTHQFDLAALAIAAAARRTALRRYDARVSDPLNGLQRAVLLRDGRTVLAWETEARHIVHPAPWAGLALGTGFTAWTTTALDAELAEAALVLRRAVFISSGRGKIALLDALDHAPARGGCWVEQPERAAAAKRKHGSTIDFADAVGRLTRSDDRWLAFEA